MNDMERQTNDFSQKSENSPQFELIESNGWGKRFKEWLNKYGSSVLLPIIALAILASGIYLYATQKNQQASMILPPEESITANIIPAETKNVEQEKDTDQQTTDQQTTENITVNVQPEEQTDKIIEVLPEKKADGTILTMKAEKGEGITHLARKALKNYLDGNQQAQSIVSTKEHKIYIEDYIKDKIGSKTLGVGEEIGISEDLINEAINSSAKLTQDQLEVIKKFSALVVSKI